ncbi:sensor domain-containing diguanylate cyclase [Symbioplanes lichenis]|uniref:sensor domain-containing diguanylate cyclase n=1 Tax=Symbioplanes lichenis TaxID=1629072 RepID=UPI002738A76B|nr:sensor domain-containing diguanylate cyclase [Actinoplanes lichenis]
MRWTAGPRTGRSWVVVLLVAAVLVAGGVVTGVVGYALERAEERYAAQSMNRYASDVGSGVSAEVERYGGTLTDLSRALAAQGDLSRDDFTDITGGLEADRFPGVSGFAFVVPASADEFAPIQRYWRAEGATGLTLRPVGAREDHAFVVYSQSVDGSPAATPGADTSTVPELVETMTVARSTGLLATTRSYVLLKDRSLPAARQQASFSLVAPVRTRTGVFRGWLVMGVHGKDFLDRTLSERAEGMVRVILDEASVSGAVVIASADVGTLDPDRSLVRERAISVGQRVWRLTLLPTSRLRHNSDHELTAVAIGACIGVTLILALLVGLLAGARNRAVTQVERATADLREDIARRETVEVRLRERESELRHLALHDPLTGLANRVLFYERVAHALLTHARTGHTFAVIFLDLDGFKEVNDRLGHGAGDELLIQVAERLRGCLRASDTIARFGGDEFAVITERLASAEDFRAAAERIVEVIGRPYDLGAGPATVSASVGIARNRPGDDADDVLREADMAMYEAKKSGKGRFVVAAPR